MSQPLEGEVRFNYSQIFVGGRWRQLRPRDAVEGDIYPGGHLRPQNWERARGNYINRLRDFKFTYGEYWERSGQRTHQVRVVDPLNRTQRWIQGNDPDPTIELSERIAELRTELDRQVRMRLNTERDCYTRAEQVLKLQQQLDEQEIKLRTVDKLESELRSTQRLRDSYIRAAQRRLDKMVEMSTAADVREDFITLLQGRLAKARCMITRLCLATGLAPPNDADLDP